MILKVSKKFVKHYALLPFNIRQKVDSVLDVFVVDPFNRELRNHELHGTFSGFRSIDVTGSYRIHFRELSEGRYELVEIVDVGTHSQLYG